MLIGFTEKTRTVSEAADGFDDFLFFINVKTETDSELRWEIVFRHVDVVGNDVADVTFFNYAEDNATFDATFGTLMDDLLQETQFLDPGTETIKDLETRIIDDFAAEETEYFTLSIAFVPPIGIRNNAECIDALGFYCTFTVFIIDDDG